MNGRLLLLCAALALGGCHARGTADLGLGRKVEREANGPQQPTDAEVFAARQRALDHARALGVQNVTVEVLDDALEPVANIRFRVVDDDLNRWHAPPTGTDGRTTFTLPTLEGVRWEQFYGGEWRATAARRLVEEKSGGVRYVFPERPDERPRGRTRSAAPARSDENGERHSTLRRPTWLQALHDRAMADGDDTAATYYAELLKGERQRLAKTGGRQ